MNGDAVALYRSYRAPVRELWPHLTRPELLARWLGTADFELVSGGAARIEAWNGDQMAGQVAAISAPGWIKFAWRRFGFDDEEPVAWRLEGDGPGSRVVVEHENLRSPEEKTFARRFWREALDALRECVDCHQANPEWGATLPVVVRASLGRPAAELWPLFTTPSGLSKWVARVERFDATAGGEFRFLSRYQGRDVVEEGRIEEIAPAQRLRLAWEWRGEDWGNPTAVEFRLEPRAGGTSLLLVHSGFEQIASGKAATARRNYASGWAGVVRDLARLLAPAPTS
jgi:uncharacterized protein YndB with AHSA1/START domain